ncbi:MAG: terpene cyclase/mutase family protein [Planctomycetes bacterium]|nr:terpene cyclase/mutase family protein [Planctomycetota bacterium]
MIGCRALLILLVAVAALPAQIGDLDPLVVEILDAEDRRLGGTGLPILFRGKRPTSIEQLQGWMRVVAAPAEEENQDRDASVVLPPSPRYPKTQHPSNRMLVIRCSPHQDAAWVQAVVQAAWVLPWRGLPDQVQASPLIQDVRIGLLDKNTRTPVAVSRTIRNKADGTRSRCVELLLRIFAQEPHPPTTRPVVLQLGTYTRPLGTINGYRLHPTNADAAKFDYEPRLLGFRFREKMGAIRKDDPDAQIKVIANPRVPFVVLHSVLQLIDANELAAVFDGYVSLRTIRSLSRSYIDHEEPPSDPATTPPSGQPAPGQGAADQPAVQRAVDLGLAWLLRSQSQDGRWDADGFVHVGVDGMLKGHGTQDVGVTGLVLLALDASGHGAETKGSYAEAIQSGLKWLVAQQDGEGGIGLRADSQFSYGHAVAAQAIIKAYGRTGATWLKTAARKATRFILDAQNPYRAWRYGVRPGDNDSHVTSWMLAALVAAKAADLEVTVSSLKYALDYLDALTDQETGRTGYIKRGERPVRAQGRRLSFPAEASEALTAAAMWCRLTLKPETTDAFITRAGAELFSECLPTWDATGSVDMIYWYWGTRTLKVLGGPPWEVWRRRLTHELLQHQVAEGDHAGGFRPVGAWGSEGGAVYSTALMTHTLALLK